MSTRSKLSAVITFTALAAFSGTALAANGETALGNCYNMVIASCNQGNHPVPCAENGMDQCDEQYGNQIARPLNNFKAKGKKRTLGLLLPAVNQ